MSKPQKRRDRGTSSAPPQPLLRCWQELLEESVPLPVVPRFRAFVPVRSSVVLNSAKDLRLDVFLELRSYSTAEDRSSDKNPEVHARFTVDDCEYTREWRSQLRSKIQPHESDLRWLMKELVPFECSVRIETPQTQTEGGTIWRRAQFALRIGLLTPSVRDLQRLAGFGRYAKPALPMLWELWPRNLDKPRLVPPYDAWMFALRVKLAQLFDRALERPTTDTRAIDSAHSRLPLVLLEEEACLREQSGLARQVADIETLIEDCRTVDLWLPEDAEEPQLRRARADIIKLNAHRAMIEPGRTAELARCDRDLWSANRRLESLEAQRATRRRVLEARASAATTELVAKQAALTQLGKKADMLLFEREGLRTLLTPR